MQNALTFFPPHCIVQQQLIRTTFRHLRNRIRIPCDPAIRHLRDPVAWHKLIDIRKTIPNFPMK